MEGSCSASSSRGRAVSGVDVTNLRLGSRHCRTRTTIKYHPFKGEERRNCLDIYNDHRIPWALTITLLSCTFTMPSIMWNRFVSRLPPVLRPRWTWRYVLCFGVATYSIYCLLFASPMLSSRLPEYTGPYSVGAIDLEIPCEPRRLNDARLKDDGHHAFQVRQPAQLLLESRRTGR